MLTNKQKALLLFSVLDDQTSKILPYLSEASVRFLSSSLEETPEKTPKAIQELLASIQNGKSPAPLSPSTETGTASLENLEMPGQDGLSSLFQAEEEPTSPQPGDVRTPEKIASILSKQKHQITAFVLSKIDEDLKAKILEQMTADQVEMIESINVSSLPLSDQIFQSLYQEIFIHKEEDDLAQEDAQTQENNKEPASFSFSSFGSSDAEEPKAETESENGWNFSGF